MLFGTVLAVLPQATHEFVGALTKLHTRLLLLFIRQVIPKARGLLRVAIPYQVTPERVLIAGFNGQCVRLCCSRNTLAGCRVR
jgi:hypothetical protein